MRFIKRIRDPKWKRKKISEFGLTLVFASLFLGGLAWLSRVEYLTIATIEVKGTKALSHEAVSTHIQDALEGNRFLIFPKKNIFIAEAGELENVLRREFESIDTVHVEFEDVHRLVVDVVERTPHFLWCGEVSQADEVCFFLDQGGFVFSAAPQFTGVVYVRTYGVLGSEETVGSRFLDEVTFRKIGSFIEKMKQAGFSVSKMIAQGGDEFELYLEGGTKVFFNPSQDLEKALHNFMLVFSPKGEVDRKKLEGMEYIDLRFNNKVFYREAEREN